MAQPIDATIGFGRRSLLGAAGASLLASPALSQGAGQTIRIAVVRATVLAPALVVRQFLPPAGRPSWWSSSPPAT